MKKELSSIFLRLAIWLCLAIVLFVTATTLFSDLGRVIVMIRSVSAGWLALIILSVLFNYGLRFLKWRYFLAILGVKVPLRLNLWVFFSAFTMVLSPAKLGELVKSLLLKARMGIPVAVTAPVVMAERLTDLAGLLILCVLGFSRFAFGGRTLLVCSILIFAGMIVFSRPGFWHFIDRLPLVRKRSAGFRATVRAIAESTRTLLTLRSLFITVPLSAVSWAGEGVALYLIFRSLGLEIVNLPAISVFAHAFGSVAGALSFLPGGLLVTEGAMGMFFVYVSIPDVIAVSATFLIRALTLWFAVILGTIVFVLGHRSSDLEMLSFSSLPDSSDSRAADR